ncbi:MAG: DUF2442 domain-containing protein [Acidobacteria bacterium]|nr:DUF2442 domain-containing protein [Acidobacteriota bacterium]
MCRVVRVHPLSRYRLWVEFSDGLTGEVDLSDRLWGPAFEPLKERSFFDRVSIDEFGAIGWPGGASLAPDALYKKLAAEVGVAENAG